MAARSLARQLEAAHSRTRELILASEESILKSDKLIRKAQEYCQPCPSCAHPGETF